MVNPESLRSLETRELEDLIWTLQSERVQRASATAARKRERDAQRHMDVHCPTCGAGERTRCMVAGKRTDASHTERAWKTVDCPACGAPAGEWCRVGGAPEFCNVTRPHLARVEGTT